MTHTNNYDEAIGLVVLAKYGVGDNVEGLRKAVWYIERQIRNLEGCPDIHQPDIHQQDVLTKRNAHMRES